MKPYEKVGIPPLKLYMMLRKGRKKSVDSSSQSRGTAGLNTKVMFTVRAKFKCYEIAEFQSGKYVSPTAEETAADPNAKAKWTQCKALKFKFQIVSGGSPENDHFYAVSGGSNLEMVTVNEAVFNCFKVGGEYYADLTPAE